MCSQVFKEIRIRLWLREMRSLTGLQATHALAARFDPCSMWDGGDGTKHQSKWYRYENGEAVPSERLAERVKVVLPGQTFDLHHPTWTLLRKSKFSTKTIDRLIKRMSPLWREALKRLNDDDFGFRRIDLDLVNRYHLADMGYLDALLLFLLARKRTLDGGPNEAVKAEQLTSVILVLPLLYIDDPVWLLQNTSEKKRTLHAIAQYLRSGNDFSGKICFPRDRLVRAMAMQNVLKLQHIKSHPRSISSPQKQIRFLAKCMANHANAPYAIATRAFVLESVVPLRSSLRFMIAGIPDTYALPLWRWAWSRLKQGAEYSHFADCLRGRLT